MNELCFQDPPLVHLIATLETCAAEDLSTVIANAVAPATGLPKSDLHHWIKVLNRFDAVLADFVTASTATTAPLSDLQQQPQSSSVSPLLENTVVAVLNMSRLLWDCCTSRSLYSSFEHVTVLLESRSINVATAALHFLVRPPQRQSKPRLAKLALAPAHPALTTLASRWSSSVSLSALVALLKDNPTALSESSNVTIANISSFNFYYYSATTADASSKKAAAAATAAATAAASAASSTPAATSAGPFLTPSKPIQTSMLGSASSTPLPFANYSPASTPLKNTAIATAPQSSGLVTVSVPNVFESTHSSCTEFVDWVMEEFSVPAEDAFSVFHKARCAFSFDVRNNGSIESAIDRIRDLVVMRVLALAVCVSLLPEDVCQSKFYLYEPDLAQTLAEIVSLSTSSSVTYTLQAGALYTLEAMSRHKAHTMDVLNAVGASVNHGIMVSTTRRVVSLLETGAESDIDDAADFVEAFFGFASQLLNSTVAGGMIVSSGIVQVVAKVFSVVRVSQMKNVAKFVTFLDLMMYSFPNALAAFTACNGVELLVGRIKTEVAACLEAKGTHETFSANVTNGTQVSTLNDISFLQVTLLRSLLKFIMHMMQASGGTDQLRNLIETSLPSSVLIIFENSKFFGANVFGLAINIMSTFIHNEPASLAILQESRLPQTLLSLASSGEFPISAEVISALPNAFGAICLNQVGLEAFTASNPLPRYLRLLISNEPSVRMAFYDRDMPNVIGNAVDELVRHHPSLKDGAVAAVIEILKDVLDVGDEEKEEESSLWRLRGIGTANEDAMVVTTASGDTTTDGSANETGDERKESRIGTLVDVMARFLEGLFQNPAHCKDFVKLGGVELLIQIYSLPYLPVEYALSSTGGHSLLFLFRILTESSKEQVIPLLQDSLSSAIERVNDFVRDTGSGDTKVAWSLRCIDFSGASDETIAQAQKYFRSFITLECLIRLVADMFSSHHHSHSKSVQAVVTAFTGEKGEKILASFSTLHRACILDASLLKDSVPKAWYEMNPKKSSASSNSNGNGIGVVGQSGLSRQVSNANLPNGFDDASSDLHFDTTVEESAVGTAASTAAGSAGTKKAVEDYRMMNTYYFKEFTTQIPSILTGMYQSIVRLLTTKVISHVPHRKPAQTVIDTIAQTVVDTLDTDVSLLVTRGVKDEVRIVYLNSMLTILDSMVTDKRSQGSLQTSWVASFDRCGGVDKFLEFTGALWKKLSEDLSSGAGAGKIAASTKGEENSTTFGGNGKEEGVGGWIGLFEKSLIVIATLCDMKTLHNSPFTFSIHGGKDKDKENAVETFDAYQHLVKIRMRVLPLVQQIWESNVLYEFRESPVSSDTAASANTAAGGKNASSAGATPISGGGVGIWKPLLAIITQILKAEGEVSITRTSANSSSTDSANGSSSGAGLSLSSPFAQALFGRIGGGGGSGSGLGGGTVAIADAARVEQLVDMGYPRRAAETALIRCGNSLMRAVDYIISHPALITDALASADAAAAAATVAAAAGGGGAVAPGGPSNGMAVLAPAAVSVPAENLAVEATGAVEATTESASGEGSSVSAALDAMDASEDDEENEHDILAQAMAMSMTAAASEEETVASGSSSATTAAVAAIEVSEDADSAAMETDQSETKVLPLVDVKGKGKLVEKSNLEILNELRAEFIAGAVTRSLELAGKVEAIIFEVKDLLCLLGKPDMSKVSNALFGVAQATLETVFEHDQVAAAERLALYLHLVALMLNDASFKKSFSAGVVARSDFFDAIASSFGTTVSELQVDSVIPKWLSSAILIVEAAVSEWEENKLVPTASASSKVLTESLAGKEVSAALIISSDLGKCVKILGPILQLLKVESLDSDSLHACLRVLVRLTRSRKISAEFVEQGGLPLLFKESRVGEFSAQLSLIVVILRHLVESKSVLARAMETDITNWFKGARSKDLNSFVKGNAPLVCRDSDVFSKVTLAICQFPMYDPKNRSPQITLKADVTNDWDTVFVVSSEEKDLAKEVTNFLVSELLETRRLDVDSEMSIEDKNKSRRLLHFKRGYLLQSLTELISSFSVCKTSVALFSKGSEKGKTPATPLKNARQPLMHFLLIDLLFLPTKANSEDASFTEKCDATESSWAVSLITKLCTGPVNSEDKSLNEQHQTTCKTVVEAISRALKDVLISSDGVETRYGRFNGLADLCLQILVIRYPPQSSKIPTSQNPILSATKSMLEKGFVNTLTTVLAEIDPFHPKAKALTGAILKPLEMLTKMAVKIAKLPVNADKQTVSLHKKSSSQKIAAAPVDDESSDFNSSDDEDRTGMAESENEEINNIYRNSALNMYNPVNVEDVDMDDISDSDDDGDDEDEYDEFDEDDEFSGDEDEDDDDDNSDPEDDMEIVVPQPYHGAHDEFDSTDNEGNDGETDAEMHELGDSESEGDEIEIVEGSGGEEDDEDNDDEEGDEEDEEEDNGDEEENEDGEEGFDQDGDNSDEDENELNIPYDENDGQMSEEGAGSGSRRRRYIWDSVTDGFENDIFDRAIPLNRPAISIEDAHPLLINQQQAAATPIRSAPRGDRGGLLAGIGGNQSDWHSFIQTLAGPQAIQQIQQLERQGQPFRIEIQSNGQPIGDFRELFRRGGGDPGVASEMLLQAATERLAPEDRPLISLQSASIQTNAQRWVYEARLFFGSDYADLALSVTETIVTLLSPAALEERRLREIKEKEEAELKAKEDEERRIKAEEEKRIAEAAAAEAARIKIEEEKERIRKEKEEAERKEAEERERTERAEQAEQAESSGQAMEGVETGEATEPVETVAESIEVAPEAPARVFVEVGGENIDITDSGIDPEFLAALPEDLRMEVLNQHLQEQRQRDEIAPIVNENPDMSEFLNALPPDIRNEVIQQQRRPTGSRAGQTALGELDEAGFLAALEPALRHAVMRDDDQDFLNGLPHNLRAEANSALRSMARLRQGIRQLTQRIGGGSGQSADDGVSTPPKILKKSTRDVVQLVEKPALFTLLRLLFVPEPANKDTLNRLLLNLCENSRSRLDLISIFLSILWDGNADFVLLDKNFSQMSIKGKGKQTVSSKKIAPSNAQPFEAIPNLIVQRCLETLNFLVGSNDQIVVFFLQENEQFAHTFGKYRPQSRKGKGKEKAISNIFPVVVLLSLVERPIFLTNPMLLEQLVQLLTFVLRPISSLGAGKAKDAATIGVTPVASAPQLESATVTGFAEDGEAVINSNVVESSSEKPPTVPVGPELAEEVLKVPMIPDQYIRAIVQVLTVGECSIKTFQYTLSMIQHLAPLNNNREIITNELISHSQSLGNAIVTDLNAVASDLTANKKDVDVNSGPLAKFSTAASQQAKLLRVLKTLDYIHTKLQQSLKEKEEKEILAKLKAAIASAASAGTNSTTSVSASESAPSGSAAMETDLRKVEPTIEENLTAIYNKIHLSNLWNSLGKVMAIVSEDDDLTRVGTVLLPLIESFMVISKPFVASKAGNLPATGVTVTRLIHSTSGIKGKDTKTLSHEELFINFTEEHKKILNVMVRNNPTLMSGSFSLLVQNPKVLEFDNKRTFFTQQLHKKSGTQHYSSLQLNVRRSMVFEDSYHQLHGRSGDEIKYGKLNIRFHDEEGVDAGGVTREFFQVLARQMFNPDYALFKPSAVDKVTYQPNPLSWINGDHLMYFRFVGRIIGKAIYDGRLLDAYFTRSFYKHMLEISVDWKDMEAIDPEFHKSLQWMLENDITDVIDLSFSTEIDDFGVERIIDLKPNGRNILVTEENKQEYVSLITEQKLKKAIQQQIDAFLGGFHDVIPKDLIKIFNEQELELLISGLPDIDIDDMKNNCEYQNYSSSSPQIQWFWRAVRSFSQEERAKLIQFATGTSKVPLEGFKALEGSNGIQKFQIHKDFASKLRLPSAHTCFNQIDLPEYDSYEDLRANLLTAISECATGFGFV